MKPAIVALSLLALSQVPPSCATQQSAEQATDRAPEPAPQLALGDLLARARAHLGARPSGTLRLEGWIAFHPR